MRAQARLEQVRHAAKHELGHGLECVLMGAACSELHYELRMSDMQTPVIEAKCYLSGQFQRIGARRLNIFLSR